MTETATKPQIDTETLREPTNAGEVAVFAPPRLAYHPAIQQRFNVDKAGWMALIDAVWPLAKTADAVCLALAYCQKRNLDPFKKVVHVVPLWSAAQNRMVETVWPGIAELRTTAFRTQEYAGHDPVEYGPDVTAKIGTVDIKFPEWCSMTVHRLVQGKHIRAFPGPRVYWTESYSTAKRDDPSPNAMWRKRPYGQLEKCAEAAALRAAFPEEIGGEYAAEEMEGKVIDGHAQEAPGPRPSQSMFDRAKQADADEGPSGEYPLVDEAGETEQVCTYPAQWVKELLAATAPTVDGGFTDKALKILANNAEATVAITGMLESDQLAAKLEERYRAADGWRQAQTATGAAGEGPKASPAAATTETPKSAPVTPPPPVRESDPAGAAQNTVPSPAVPPPAQGAPSVEPERAAGSKAAPAPEKPAHPIPMPNSTRTKGPDSAAYLLQMQKILNDAKPEDIDGIMSAEQANLSKVMPRTKASIELWAGMRKQGKKV